MGVQAEPWEKGAQFWILLGFFGGSIVQGVGYGWAGTGAGLALAALPGVAVLTGEEWIKEPCG